MKATPSTLAMAGQHVARHRSRTVEEAEHARRQAHLGVAQHGRQHG